MARWSVFFFLLTAAAASAALGLIDVAYPGVALIGAFIFGFMGILTFVIALFPGRGRGLYFFGEAMSFIVMAGVVIAGFVWFSEDVSVEQAGRVIDRNLDDARVGMREAVVDIEEATAPAVVDARETASEALDDASDEVHDEAEELEEELEDDGI